MQQKTPGVSRNHFLNGQTVSWQLSFPNCICTLDYIIMTAPVMDLERKGPMMPDRAGGAGKFGELDRVGSGWELGVCSLRNSEPI